MITQNKVRIVAQGYNEEEDIDYEETYAPVAPLKAIHLFLVFACSNDFNKLFQIYIDDIIFGFTNMQLVKEFSNLA